MVRFEELPACVRIAAERQYGGTFLADSWWIYGSTSESYQFRLDGVAAEIETNGE